MHQRNVNVTNYQNEMESMNKISLMLNDLIKQELTRNIILIAIARVYYVRARVCVCVCVCVCAIYSACNRNINGFSYLV